MCDNDTKSIVSKNHLNGELVVLGVRQFEPMGYNIFIGGKMVAVVSRYIGCLLGLACGDAVGTTVEFSSRGTFRPVDDMQGGGPFDLEPGQ